MAGYEETAVQKATRLAAERARLAREESREGVVAASDELTALRDALSELAAQVAGITKFPQSVERTSNDILVVLGRVSATLQWFNKYSDSLKHSSLIVKQWPSVVSLSTRHRPSVEFEETYQFGLDLSDRWVWIGEEERLTTEQLADRILGQLVEAAFAPPEREGYFPFRVG